MTTMSLPNIPIVSLDDIRSNDPIRQARATQALKLGFGTFGLVYVSDHDVTPAQQDRFYTAFQRFTSRPTSVKERYARADLWYQRGWTPPNTEKAVASGGSRPDFKECWFAAPIDYDKIAMMIHPELYAPNVWPNDDDDFRDVYMEMGRLCHAVGETLLRGVAQSYNLDDADAFTKLVHGVPHTTCLSCITIPPPE